jgi:hypothetical protein
MLRNENEDKDKLSQELRDLIDEMASEGMKQYFVDNAMKKVRQGAHPDTKQNYGWSLLRMLARNNVYGKYYSLIEELVKTYKADINTKDEQGYTPLESMISVKLDVKHIMNFIRLGAHDSKGKPFVNLLADDERNISLTKIDLAFLFGDEYVLRSGSYYKARNIGSGTFSQVFFGKKDEQKVAIKSYKPDINFDTFIEEADFLIKLKEQANQSSNIIHLIGIDLGIHSNIILEYASKGTLSDFMKAKSADWKTRYTFVKGVVSGLKFIHDCKIIHCDIKVANILLDGDDLQVKICDFTNALNEGAAAAYPRTSAAYCAPEVYQMSNHTRASDVFSLGVLIWEIAAWRQAWNVLIEVIYKDQAISLTDKDRDEIIKNIHEYYAGGKRLGIPSKKPNKTPSKISSMIHMCWSGDASRRPTAPKLEKELSTDICIESDACRQMRL